MKNAVQYSWFSTSDKNSEENLKVPLWCCIKPIISLAQNREAELGKWREGDKNEQSYWTFEEDWENCSAIQLDQNHLHGGEG